MRANVGVLALSVLLCSTGCTDDSRRADVLRLQVGSRDVFLKRLTWGRNGSLVVLSVSPDATDIPGAGDFRWRGQEPPQLLFRVEGKALHIYGSGMADWVAPSSPEKFPVLVILHQVEPSLEGRMLDDPAAFALAKAAPWEMRPLPVAPTDVSRETTKAR